VTDERLPGTIHETARMVEDAGGEAIAAPCNVVDTASVEAMVEAALARWGRIDVLMTNAAVQAPGGVSTIKPKSWELEFNINVHGVFRCIRAVLPTMQAQGSGSIINISSAATRGGSHYGATKRAVEAMTISLARELKDQGVAVNALKPVGAIETPGMLFVDPQGPRQRPELPRPDSYVEAAIQLALATPATFTGQVFDDAQLIERLASAEAKARFRAENPANWVAAMTA
jgi:NAD(P)-dependent dehydrogenase (short-subunit alcohol dehydrogenase family)